jgi:transcriptional regulator with XRE-family HTH domain
VIRSACVATLPLVAARPSPDELRARIASRIRELVARKKMSLNELSKAAGISRGHLWNLTSGSRAPTTDVLAKLGAALDVDPVTFLRPYKGKATEQDDGE